MFDCFKKPSKASPAPERVAHQPLGEVFPWPKRWRLTAIDEAIIAVPVAILGDNDTIGSIIHCDEDVRLNLPTGPRTSPEDRIMIWLKPGQSVWLGKSCQAVLLPIHEEDKAPRRFTLAEIA
jgi:hypothetical protein